MNGLKAAFRQAAVGLEKLDLEVYRQFDRDPLEPVIGAANPDCRVGFFGRDPGRDEVRHQMPFIGAGGQKVRGTLYRHLHGREMADMEASLSVGSGFFWANTVPYKPIGNKAWSMAVKRTFQPLVARLLSSHWRGEELITLGRESFLWFSINQPREVKRELEAFWGSPERFSECCEIALQLENGGSKRLRLHPLPHPSPLNATWYKRFPALLEQRLEQLEVTPDSLMLGP